MRRGELLLVLGFVALLLLAAFLGKRTAPQPPDTRRSTYLASPDGARGLADALAAFGVTVERRRYPLFDLVASRRPGDVLMIVEPVVPLTLAERRQVVDYLRAGGQVVLAGETGVGPRLGFAIVAVADRGARADSLRVAAPAGIGALPGVEQVVGHGRPPVEERRDVLVPARADTLLSVGNGWPMAVRLTFEGGGRALLVADSRWLENRVLKNTDAGALVIPWMLALQPRRIVADEYHQGFGRSGAIFTAALGWLVRSPAGWAILQLAFAGLVALAAGAVRFGPALHVLVRARRSPVEHLDALAAGLERSGGHRTAMELLVRGLRRRLQRAGAPGRPGPEQSAAWLDALGRATDRPETQRAVKRLRSLMREPGSGEEQVLRTAQAVEDVWQALKQARRLEPS